MCVYVYSGATLELHPSPIACGQHRAELFCHMEPRNPMETRWLPGEELSEQELSELLDFLSNCVAQNVWDGASFEISLDPAFVEKIERGELGYEHAPTYKQEVADLELLPGTWLQVGRFPLASDCAHRGPLFKQMALDGGTNIGGNFWFNSATGWCCSDRLETFINADKHEVPSGLSIAFGYRAYGSAKGRDRSAFPESVHWPDWASRPTTGINCSDTGSGISQEVEQFQHWLADNPSSRAAAVAEARAADEDSNVPGCQGKLAQRYLKFLHDDPNAASAEEHTFHVAIFAYLSGQKLRCKCDSLGAQLQRQYPEVNDFVTKSPRLPFAVHRRAQKVTNLWISTCYMCVFCFLVTSLRRRICKRRCDALYIYIYIYIYTYTNTCQRAAVGWLVASARCARATPIMFVYALRASSPPVVGATVDRRVRRCGRPASPGSGRRQAQPQSSRGGSTYRQRLLEP
jgi:hypothetical protein